MIWLMKKNLDDMADTVADVGPDHDLREALHGLLLDYLQSKVRLEDNYFVLVEYCQKKVIANLFEGKLCCL